MDTKMTDVFNENDSDTPMNSEEFTQAILKVDPDFADVIDDAGDMWIEHLVVLELSERGFPDSEKWMKIADRLEDNESCMTAEEQRSAIAYLKSGEDPPPAADRLK